MPRANGGNNTRWTLTKKELLAHIFREAVESGRIDAVNAMTAAQAWEAHPEFASGSYAHNNFLSAFKRAQTAEITAHGAGSGAAEADATTQGASKILVFAFCFSNLIDAHCFIIFSDSKCGCLWASA